MGTHALMLRSMNDGLYEERRQMQAAQCAVNDLSEKMDEMKDQIMQREQEK